MLPLNIVQKVKLKLVKKRKGITKLNNPDAEKQDEGTSDLMLLGLQKVKILNLNNEKKISPKTLDRTIFLYSSYKQTGYLNTHRFHEEFCEKTKKHYFQNTLEYTKHIELINSLSF